MSGDRIPVKPRVMQWARESVGLDLASAARKLQVSPGSVEQWEDGSLRPTIKQLRHAASVYRRPLAALLLPEPPVDFDAMRDFRRVRAVGTVWTHGLHSEFRRALSQRDVLLELAEIRSENVPASVDFVVNQGESPDVAAERLREVLRLDDIRSAAWAQPREALAACISRAEALGVLVVQTRGIDTDEMKGFSVAEWPFPVVALNGSDWPRPRLFTLMHEMGLLARSCGFRVAATCRPRGR